MKVFTNYQIAVDQSFTFWGEGNGDLEIGSIVYLWQHLIIG